MDLKIRFAHVGDVHLGSSFAWTKEERQADFFRDAQFQALGDTLRIAVEKGCKFVLFAGDLFDSAFADKHSITRFCQLIKAYQDLPCFIAAGNRRPRVRGRRL